MYQLILHHVYRNGPHAIDLSGAENDGLVTAASYLHDGAEPGSGALVFKSSHARVRVPLNKKGLFKHLFALKIEIVVRIDALGQRRNLVEGDASFAFFLDPDGHLWGAFNGPQYAGGPPVWHGANSRDNAPGGAPHKVPLGRWVTLRYEHDGYASLRLYIDDVLVAANYSLRSGIPPVVNTGINIGNWTLSDAYPFDGAVDEVKIWRWDPDEALGQFLGRPMDRCSAPCWRQLFDWLEQKLRDPHERLRILRMLHCIGAAQNDMLRLLRSKGEDAIAANAEHSEKYRKLWQQPLDSDAMRGWQQDWFKWLISVVGEDAWCQYTERMQHCLIDSDLLNRLPGFDCDPEFAAYLMGFGEATGNPIAHDDCKGKTHGPDSPAAH
jgi:hypothetical protein